MGTEGKQEAAGGEESTTGGLISRGEEWHGGNLSTLFDFIWFLSFCFVFFFATWTMYNWTFLFRIYSNLTGVLDQLEINVVQSKICGRDWKWRQATARWFSKDFKEFVKCFEGFCSILKDFEGFLSILKYFEGFWSILKDFEVFWRILKYFEGCSSRMIFAPQMIGEETCPGLITLEFDK